MRIFTTFWHKNLRRPYQLYCRTKLGQGQPVVLLHGIASSADAWRHVTKLLSDQPCQVVAFDLLGFGRSPKPIDDWVAYNVDDHARAIIASLRHQKVKPPAILVGHSMGCLVAIRLATLRPDLVSQLILYEPPFLAGLPETAQYQRQRNFYLRIYRQLVKRPPASLGKFRLVKSLLTRMIGFELTEATWIPFERSMKNTILDQTAVAELHQLTIPTTIMYGKFDGLVINDKKQYFFDVAANHITSSEVPELHAISPRASKLIASRISELLAK